MRGKIRAGILLAAGFAIIAAVVFGMVRMFGEGGTVQHGVASWYGPGFHGKKTASGKRFNQHALTAASRTLPLGTRVLVTNLDNGKSVEVTINDRGPYVDGRIIDLSRAAARRIRMIKPGTVPVRIEVISDKDDTE